MDHRIPLDRLDHVPHAGEQECIVSEPGRGIDDGERCPAPTGLPTPHGAAEWLVSRQTTGPRPCVDPGEVDPEPATSGCLVPDLEMVLLEHETEFVRLHLFMGRGMQAKCPSHIIQIPHVLRDPRIDRDQWFGIMHRSGNGDRYTRAMRRMQITALVGLLFILLGPAACRSQDGTPRRISRINHIVLIKLQDPGRTEALVIDCRNRLERIPTVAGAFTGRHGEFGRSGVDDDYDVGFFVSFETDADYRAYLEHPEHVAVVTEWKPEFEWIRIHDVVDETAAPSN